MTYNLRHALEKAERDTGETIEAIVVGKHDRDYSGIDGSDENVLLSRDAGLAKLDQDYDSGYGGADCYPFWAWTATRVYFVAEYDGATWITWTPRHPVALRAEFSGVQ